MKIDRATVRHGTVDENDYTGRKKASCCTKQLTNREMQNDCRTIFYCRGISRPVLESESKHSVQEFSSSQYSTSISVVTRRVKDERLL